MGGKLAKVTFSGINLASILISFLSRSIMIMRKSELRLQTNFVIVRFYQFRDSRYVQYGNTLM